MNIIEQLKQNTSAFGLMSDEMQEKAKEIGFHGNFRICLGKQFGGIINNPEYALDEGLTYQLRADYQQEEGVVKIPIHLLYDKLNFVKDSSSWLLEQAVHYPDFIGYLYEDGTVSTTPRVYIKHSSSTTLTNSRTFPDYKVLTPTHVLFRSK